MADPRNKVRTRQLISRLLRESVSIDRQFGVQRGFFPQLPSVDYDKPYFLNMTEKLEASYSYMYLDTKANITVGVGCMLPNAKAAQQLPFVHRADPSQKATAKEIAGQFQQLSARGASLTPDQLRRLGADQQEDFSNLELPDTAIRQQLASQIDAFEGSLKRHFGIAWLQLPTEAKMGLLSMTFAAGFGNMLGKYYNILSFVSRRQWIKVLQGTSNRLSFLPEASTARAQWTRELFAAAVDIEKLEQGRAAV